MVSCVKLGLQNKICLIDTSVIMPGNCVNFKPMQYASASFNKIVAEKLRRVRLQSHGAKYHSDSFVLILRYCATLKAIRYETTSLNRIVAD